MADGNQLYLVSQRCPQGRPSGTTDLIATYDLKELASLVARQDPVTGQKRKLRKSYKNHISDLPGKHPIPNVGETPWSLVNMALQPPIGPSQELNKPIKPSLLQALKFERSVGSGVPGFDPKLLATPGVAHSDSTLGYGSPAAQSPDERKEKKRKKDPQSAVPEKRRRVFSS